MRILLLSNKKGVSLIVSYVLLITIAVALSVLVYNWLRFYVNDGGEETNCKEGTSIIIQNYECSLSEDVLNITLKNKGRFPVDGFILKVHDREGAEIGLYTLTEIGEPIGIAEVFNEKYSFSLVEDYTLTDITLIEVQPFILENGEKVFCDRISSQTVDCS